MSLFGLGADATRVAGLRALKNFIGARSTTQSNYTANRKSKAREGQPAGNPFCPVCFEKEGILTETSRAACRAGGGETGANVYQRAERKIAIVKKAAMAPMRSPITKPVKNISLRDDNSSHKIL